MDLNDLTIDTAKFEQGDWVDNIPDMGDVRLKVRGLGNADYRRMMAKLTAAVPRAKKVGGQIDAEEQDRITNQCLVSTVLLDWDGLKAGGQPLPYSKEKAQELINDPRYRRFRDAVIWAGSVVAEQNGETVEGAAGN